MNEKTNQQENKNENKEKRGFKGNQGFYIVLVLCLLAVGAAVALLAFTPTGAAPAPPTALVGQSDDQLMADVLAARTLAPTAVPTAMPTAAVTSPQPTQTPAPTASAKATSSSTKAAPPLTGGITWGFAVDKLIYSKTLDAWVTHEGVDIAADRGAKVKCVFAGTVEKVYEDDYLGHAVLVRHTNNRSTLYANLDSAVSVKEGDKVNAGDALGKVGSSAMSEIGDGPHLHFAMYIDGKPVNPANYVRLG